MAVISVLIVSWNTCEYTLRAVASAVDASNRRQVEVIVVDNASSDGSADAIAEHFPNVRLVRSAENIGFGRANNLAADLAAGEHLLLLNSDAALDPGALDVLAASLDADASVGCAAPRLHFPDGAPQPSCAPFPAPFSEAMAALGIDRWLLPHRTPDRYGRRVWAATRPLPVDWATGACLLVRRAALHGEPLFDTRFFMYSEETDLCLRLRRRGYATLFVPEASAMHVGGASGRALDHAMLRTFYQSREIFLRKHYGRSAAVAFHAALRIGSLLRVVAASLLSRVQRDPAWDRTRARYAALRKEL
jgi:GT2 family glycosyltransferase